jgi:phage recombination protein Bet
MPPGDGRRFTDNPKELTVNQIARIYPTNALAAWTPRQLETIRRTVAKDTNDDEFNLFIEYARVKQLDPFSKQVIAIVFSKNDDAKRQMTIITTQEGCRVLASRCHDYRPEEAEPEYEYDISLKGPANPLGIVKCTVRLWKQDNAGKWHPVNGTAYWDEFVPLKTNPAAFDWIDTGEVWPDTKKPKKKKVLKEGADLAPAVDDSGQWAKMPRNQIAKCARMQALRGGWPETFSGVYAPEEMDRAVAQDMTASEMVESEREQRRMKTIAMSDDEYPFVDHEGTLSFLAAGRYADHILMTARNCTELAELDGMKSRNREGLQRFWARHKDDALAVSHGLEELRGALARKAGGV